MKNVKILLSIIIINLILVSAVFSRELTGKVVADTGNPVADATVVLLETDDITITEADGSFTLYLIPDTPFTILVSVPGFIEKEFPELELSSVPLTLIIEPEVVEMDTITVKAEPQKAAAEINDGVTSEELESEPVGADPFDALAKEDGIIKELDIMSAAVSESMSMSDTSEGSPLVLPERRMKTAERSEVTVYGGESDWNNYYYDYIRLPSNKHVYGSPEAEAVIPREAVDSIEVYKGASPVEYGPGIGGVFVLNPKRAEDGWNFTLTPSTSEISGLSTMRFTPELSLLVSLTQSILNFTTLPLMGLVIEIASEDQLNEDDMPTDISYGDILASLRYTPPNHDFSFDVIGFYDSYGWDLSFEEAFFNSSYLPYFAAAGSKWAWSVNPSFGNKLYVFGSLYQDTADLSYSFSGENFGFTSNYEASYKYNYQSIQAGDEAGFYLGPDLLFISGLNSRLSGLYGLYSDSQYAEDSEGTVYTNYSHSNLNYEDLLFTAYLYSKILGDTDNLDYNAGGGVLWYPQSNIFRPSVEGEIVWSLEKTSIALTAGWSPGIIDEVSLIERRIDEIYYEVDSETVLEEPPMAAIGAVQAVYMLSDDSSLKASPYFAWYYDLNGINMNTSYSDTDSQLVALDPEYGYSTGIDLTWKNNAGEFFDWSLSYAFSWTRYMTEEYGWVIPNTEVQNALKGSGSYKNGKFRLNLNLFIYSGQPFTPQIVEESGLGTTISYGDYNTAYNYVPTYELTANMSFGDDDLNFFFKTANLIDGLNYAGMELKESLQESPGSTTADFASRNYTYEYTWTDLLITLLTCELGLSISF